MTILCVATYLKGEAFLLECRRQGWTVLLLTADTLIDAAWEGRAQLTPKTLTPELDSAVNESIELLDSGQARVADPSATDDAAFEGQTFVPAGTTVGSTHKPPLSDNQKALKAAGIRLREAWDRALNLHDLFVESYKAPAKWNIPYHFEARHVGVSVPQSAIDSLARDVKPAQPESRYFSLRARADRLDDENAVQNLQHAYGYYLDRKMWQDVADLFAADGSLELANRGAYVGPERIAGALAALFGPPPLRHGELFDHIMLETVVTVAPDGLKASARTVQLGQLGLVGQFALPGIGGSDAHTVAEVGRGATRFADEIRSTAELVETLRLGRYEAVRV